MIIKREREHTVETADAVNAPRKVRREDYLGIAAGAERIIRQFPADFLIIVDFPVIDDRDFSARRMHRLMPCGREIENRKPSLRETGRISAGSRKDFRAGVIRPSPDHRVIHPRKLFL